MLTQFILILCRVSWKLVTRLRLPTSSNKTSIMIWLTIQETKPSNVVVITMCSNCGWCGEPRWDLTETSSNGTIFRVTVLCDGNHRWRHRWIPLTKASKAKLYYFSSNGWANNRDVGDFKRHRAHYYLTVVTHCQWSNPRPYKSNW